MSATTPLRRLRAALPNALLWGLGWSGVALAAGGSLKLAQRAQALAQGSRPGQLDNPGDATPSA